MSKNQNAAERSRIFQRTALENERRKYEMFVWTSVIIGSVFLAYGIFDLVSGFQPVIGWIKVIGAVIYALNVGIFHLFKKDSAVRRQTTTQRLIFGITCLTIVCAIIPDGGLYGTGIWWVFVTPIASFVYFGLLGGSMFSSLLVIFVGILMYGQSRGLFLTHYTNYQYAQGIAVLGIAIAQGIAIEFIMRRFIRIISVQQQRLDVLSRNLPVGVLMVELPSGKPLSWNRNLEILFGNSLGASFINAKTIMAFGFQKENGTQYPPENLPLIRAMHGEISSENDIFVTNEEGKTIVLRMTSAPVRDRYRTIGAVTVVEDATKEHELDQAKTEFVSFASHQLKTPLTSIKWATEVVLGGKGKLDDEQKEAAHSVEKIVDQLVQLVNDILDVSRIDTGRNFDIVTMPTDLRRVIDGVVSDMKGVAEKKNITVDVSNLPESLPCKADDRKMREVFMNLVGNSIKYTKEGGVVELGAMVDGEKLSVYVKDNGIGIPKNQQERIFERFFRAENANVVAEGTGLGLHIVRTIIERHGGKISFVSEEGKGTTFTVSLPSFDGLN